MRVLIANDKFKGSLTAAEAATAIKNGLPDGTEVDFCPIADGGEGFTSTMMAALGGKVIEVDSVDALHRPVKAHFGLTDDGLAVMEMASTNGFEQIAADDRDIMRSSTYGTGLLLLEAKRAGAKRILIGLGGSATNDGGVGMAAALGVDFLDKNEDDLAANPAELVHRLEQVDLDGLATLPPIHVACDVTNPLLGDLGATAIFGPQKGATAEDQVVLERFLTQLRDVLGMADLAKVPGAGAAGGLGFGLLAFGGAELASGFDLVAEATSLADRIVAADLVITGEGALDAQSLGGKGPVGVARLAHTAGKPCWAVAGKINPEIHSAALFEKTYALAETGLPLEDLMNQAGPLLTKGVQRLSQE